MLQATIKAIINKRLLTKILLTVKMKIIAGSSNIPLAQKIASYLNVPLMDVTFSRFADQEINVDVRESVRGEDVYILQSTSCPANDHLMELLIVIDALRRGAARRITAVIPYFGYARQDRKTTARSPISAKLVANLIQTGGAHRVSIFDLHAEQIQGFFDIPVDSLYASPLFSRDIAAHHANVTIVAPDVGAIARCRAIAKRLNTDLALIDKRREQPGIAEAMNIIGDVKGKSCILVDDIVDSGGTICSAAQALIEAGARDVFAYATHAVLSGNCLERIHHSPIQTFVFTDTILPSEKVLASSKTRILSVAPLLAEVIKRASEERSISSLFA